MCLSSFFHDCTCMWIPATTPPGSGPEAASISWFLLRPHVHLGLLCSGVGSLWNDCEGLPEEGADHAWPHSRMLRRLQNARRVRVLETLCLGGQMTAHTAPRSLRLQKWCLCQGSAHQFGPGGRYLSWRVRPPSGSYVVLFYVVPSLPLLGH